MKEVFIVTVSIMPMGGIGPVEESILCVKCTYDRAETAASSEVLRQRVLVGVTESDAPHFEKKNSDMWECDFNYGWVNITRWDVNDD